VESTGRQQLAVVPITEPYISEHVQVEDIIWYIVWRDIVQTLAWFLSGLLDFNSLSEETQ
jgi:hypothetical protein